MSAADPHTLGRHVAQQWYDEGVRAARSGARGDTTGIPETDMGLQAGEPVRWFTAGYTDTLLGRPRREITEGDIGAGAPPAPVKVEPLPQPVATPLEPEAAEEPEPPDEEPLPPPEIPEVQEYAAPAPPRPGSSSVGVALGVAAAAVGAGGLLLLLLRRRGAQLTRK